MFHLLLLRVVNSMESSSCHDMGCDSTSRNSNCIVVGSNITLYTCTEGYSCPTAILNNTDPIADVACVPMVRGSTCTGTGNLTVGRQCCTSNDCNSANCYNMVCTALSPCVVDEDCNFSSYCSGGNCVNSSPAGLGCTSDTHCEPGLGCNYGICTVLLSLDLGAPAMDGKFCLTGFFYNNICDAVTVMVNRTIQPLPFQCYISDMCNYTYTYQLSVIVILPCLCSGVANTVGYCSSYVANDASYATDMYSNLYYSSSNCGGVYASTVDPDILLECGSISKTSYLTFIQDQFHAYYWNLHNSGVLDTCATTIGLYDPNATFAAHLVISMVFIWLT